MFSYRFWLQRIKSIMAGLITQTDRNATAPNALFCSKYQAKIIQLLHAVTFFC